MKTIAFILALIIYNMVLSQTYKTKSQKDSNKYIYEVVTNDPTGTRIYTLKNGLKVYLSQNKDEPRIQTYIPVRTGSANDPTDNTGLAHYLEHMLFKGTSKIGTKNWEKEQDLLNQISELYEQHKVESNPNKKGEIYKKIDALSYEASKYAIPNEYDKMVSALGATGTNAHTWLDETVYKNNIPANELEKWLFIEKERFSELTLRLFHTELETVYEEFNRSQDNDVRLVNSTIMNSLFPNHPYGESTLGKSEHLKNPSMKAIHKFFNTYYVPNNMAIILVGDFDFNSTIQLIDKYFGHFSYKELPTKKQIIEKPITSVIKKIVKSPSTERMQLAFRGHGAGSKDAMYIKIIDLILNNSGAGLIDININQKQKVQNASSASMIFSEYSIHYFSGIPKENQSLDEVKNLLLQQIEEIKKGNFEDWILEAIVNDLKTKRIKRWEKANGVATQLYTAFIQDQTWASILDEFNEMTKISKKDIINFANNFYTDNYVIVYKEKGINDHLIRVEKPKITPVVLNRSEVSLFYKEFMKIPTKNIDPVFLDFNSLITKDKIKNTLVYFIQNQNNNLAELYYIYDLGSDYDKELPLALGYLNLLGTNKYSKEMLEKEFYKIGVEYSINVQNERIYFVLNGLEENLPKGIELLEHLLKEVKADSEVYEEYVKKILKGRKDAKSSKQSIFNALVQYARYGENNRIRNNISEIELLNASPQSLINKIKEFGNYKHEIFYYGPNIKSIKNSLTSYHNFGKKTIPPAPYTYVELPSTKKLYFTPYDMVQTEILFQSRGNKFEVSKLAYAKLFSEYFGSGLSSILFQEIRESKSLAYSAFASYTPASDKDKYDYISSYMGTQANKLSEAVETMSHLMNNMPLLEKQFEKAKNAALKQIASDRINKSSIFWAYMANKRRGLNYDVRKEVYNSIQSLQLNDLNNFFNKEIKGKSYDVCLIGKKENIDWEAAKKLGEVQELTIDDLFNY